MKKLKLNIQLFAVSLTLTQQQVSLDEDNNTSTERITATIKRTSGATFWESPYQRNMTIIVYDNETRQEITRYTVETILKRNESQRVYTKDFVIPHNEDGTKSIYVTATIVPTQSLPQLNANLTATLTTINRGILWLRVNNVWKKSIPYLRVNNQWVKCIPYVRVNNTWKKGK